MVTLLKVIVSTKLTRLDKEGEKGHTHIPHYDRQDGVRIWTALLGVESKTKNRIIHSSCLFKGQRAFRNRQVNMSRQVNMDCSLNLTTQASWIGPHHDDLARPDGTTLNNKQDKHRPPWPCYMCMALGM